VWQIPFNVPFLTGSEQKYVNEVFDNMEFSGNGPFTNKAQKILEEYLDAPKVLLTHSCTAALEMAAMLAEFGPGDEILMPSFTFVTTASSILRTGAEIVFCEIDPESMQLDLNDVKSKISNKTKGIVVVDYAGFCVDFQILREICDEYNLFCIEDAAQGLGSSWNGALLGTQTKLGAISFHQTKNLHSGLGGCLVINDRKMVEKAEIIWERGTNRSAFFKGLVDKYSWQEVGSSFYPSELQAAFLCAQLEAIDDNLLARKRIWKAYLEALKPLEGKGLFRILKPTQGCNHNAHLIALLFPSPEATDIARIHLNNNGVQAVIHYVPLHASPMGRRLGYLPTDLPETLHHSKTLLRLPLHNQVTQKDVDYIATLLDNL
tara:strand:+ start:9399 stop:10526 length:1128 start_codon:yes stop_codon:yes gene_type:complete